MKLRTAEGMRYFEAYGKWLAVALMAMMTASLAWAEAEPVVAGAAAPTAPATGLPEGPLTLEQAITIALQRHPNMVIAAASVRAAEAQVVVTRSQLFPQVELGASSQVNQSLGRLVNVGGAVIQSSGERSTQRDYEASLSWTLFRTGLWDQVRQARLEAEASRYGLADTQRALIYQVQTAYYDLLAARLDALSAMRALANATRQLDLAQARLDAGQVPQSDLLPLKVTIAQARLSLVQAETSIGVAESALRALLVAPPGTPLDLADELPSAPTLPPLADLLQAAEQSRPDIAEQKLTLESARLATRIARAQAGVSFSASGSANYGYHTGADGESWALSVGATYPLFDAGASRAEVTSAEAREVQSTQQLELTRLQLQQDLEGAVLRLRQAQEAVTVATVSRQDAQSSLDAAEARYQAGLAIILEVTDAEDQLRNADQAEVQARYALAQVIADLARVIGAVPTPVAGDAQ